MVTTNADMWIFLLVLCFIRVSSNEDPYLDTFCEQKSDVCETHTLSAPLGSSVLLPCNFETSNLNWVSWIHTPAADPGVDLLHLTSGGRIKFLDPRYGRVKAFPNQGSEGNYSICIDQLNNSDLGCYLCEQGNDCLQVKLVEERGGLRGEIWGLVFICVGVAAFILLSVGGYCCMKWILCSNNITQDTTNNPEGACTEGVSAEETGRVPVDQQRGVGHDNLVYENDDQDQSNQRDDFSRNHCNPVRAVLPDPRLTQPTQSASGIYPNLNQFERTEILKTKQRFHQELFSRLRQASGRQKYYVNQGELSQEQAMSTQAEKHRRAGLGKKKAKENGEYKNPIYNQNVDQLNHT